MTVAEQYDQHFENLQRVVNALDWARKQDLDLEWLDTFLEDYRHRTSGDMLVSIAHANREWDL